MSTPEDNPSYTRRQSVDQAFDEMIHATHLVEQEVSRLLQEFQFPQLSKRLEHLGKQKPVEFALSAFALGFTLGSHARKTPEPPPPIKEKSHPRGRS
jgi:hypothetical protein